MTGTSEQPAMPSEWLSMMVPEPLQWIRPDSCDLVDGRLTVAWNKTSDRDRFSLPVIPAEADWLCKLPPQ